MNSAELREGGMSLDEVAQEMGLSPVCVRQIECRALRKLRRALIREGLAWQMLDMLANKGER